MSFPLPRYLQPTKDSKLYNNVLMLLPISAVLRPILVVMKVDGVRRAMGHFAATLQAAYSTFLLFAFLILIATTQAMLLFYNRGMGMDDLLGAFVNIIIFMLSAENYPDVVWAPTDCNKGYIRANTTPFQAHAQNTFLGGPQSGACSEFGFHIFMIFYSFLGMFMMLSLVIGVFESSYSKRHEDSMARLRRQRRAGLLVVFYILDKDKSNVLERHEFIRFLTDTCNTGLTFDVPRGMDLEVHEFVELMEELVPYCKRSTPLSRFLHKSAHATCCNDVFMRPVVLAKFRGALRGYFNSQIHGYVMLMVSMVNIWVLMIYTDYAVDPVNGDQSNSYTLDLTLYILLFIYTLEVLLRMFASGIIGYWWQPNTFYGQMKAQYDLVMTVFVVGLVIIERTWRGAGFYFTPWPITHTSGDTVQTPEFLTDAGRIILSINALRAFSNVKTVQALFFGLLYIIPQQASVAALMLCIVHVYAIVGTLLMAGSFM